MSPASRACGPQNAAGRPFTECVLRLNVAVITAGRDVLTDDPRIERGIGPGNCGRVAHAAPPTL
jgi:hypothetical protein